MSHAVLLSFTITQETVFKHTRWRYFVSTYRSHGALVHELKQEHIWCRSTALTSFTHSAITNCHKSPTCLHAIAYRMECRNTALLAVCITSTAGFTLARKCKNKKNPKSPHSLGFPTTTNFPTLAGEIAQIQCWSWADIMVTFCAHVVAWPMDNRHVKMLWAGLLYCHRVKSLLTLTIALN